MKHRRKKSHGRRRRRIGAVALSANSPLVKFGSIAAGYLLADKVNEQIAKVTGTLDPKIVNGLLAAGGLYFSFMHKGKKSTLIAALAGLAAGVGAKGLLTDFGVISGFREMPVISGFNDVPVIGNYVPSSGQGAGLAGIADTFGYNVPASVLNGVSDYASGSGINCTDR